MVQLKAMMGVVASHQEGHPKGPETTKLCVALLVVTSVSSLLIDTRPQLISCLAWAVGRYGWDRLGTNSPTTTHQKPPPATALTCEGGALVRPVLFRPGGVGSRASQGPTHRTTQVANGGDQLLHGHAFGKAIGMLLRSQPQSIDEDVGVLGWTVGRNVARRKARCPSRPLPTEPPDAPG